MANGEIREGLDIYELSSEAVS
ncbi:hypothetical protein YERSI8AC_290011 [Enterobacterales bacterium 8AC]|nr:hypothetical protein YERSI8AC_290011 [Enterobacterales bacterium 8AC]